MRYYMKSGIHIFEVPAKDFKVIMCDERKKSAAAENYCNAGFFGGYTESGVKFTLPAGHLVCDYAAKKDCTRFYCEQRGDFVGPNKYQFDASKWEYLNNFFGKKVATLMISGDSATIFDTQFLPDGLDYAISGVPIMRGGEDVKFDPYVKGQGWSGSELYGTWHVFVGLKKDGKTCYVMGMKTKTWNMVKSGEAYKKFKSLGLHDVIKLDGGGSFIMKHGKETVASTSENRIINTIISFGSEDKAVDKNPYDKPSSTLRKGMKNKYVKWLQWQLNYLGFPCNIDGSFGPATLAQVKAFQSSRGLAVDGSVGPATRAALLSK